MHIYGDEGAPSDGSHISENVCCLRLAADIYVCMYIKKYVCMYACLHVFMCVCIMYISIFLRERERDGEI